MHCSSVTNMFWYSPLPKPASSIASYIAWLHNGVDGECFNRMEFPIMRGGIHALNGIQKGKFHGTITEKRKILLSKKHATYPRLVQEANEWSFQSSSSWLSWAVHLPGNVLSCRCSITNDWCTCRSQLQTVRSACPFLEWSGLRILPSSLSISAKGKSFSRIFSLDAGCLGRTCSGSVGMSAQCIFLARCCL